MAFGRERATHPDQIVVILDREHAYMNFLKTIRSSLYSPVFYRNARAKPLAPAIKIFAVLGAIGVAISMLFALPGLLSFAYSNFPQAIESAYPDDLVITIENGEMSIDQPQPYYIKNTLPVFSGPDAPKYIAVFDGKDKLPEDLLENSTFILLKDKYAIAPGQNNQEQIIPFSRLGTTTIQKSTIVAVVDAFKPYFIPAVLGGGALLFLILTLFGALFWVLFHMIYILIPALLMFLFGLLRGSKMTYKESYMTALYASIPVAIFFYLLGLLHILQPQYAYTLLLLLVAIANTAQTREEV